MELPYDPCFFKCNQLLAWSLLKGKSHSTTSGARISSFHYQSLGAFLLNKLLGLPCGSAGKESACNVGDLGSVPGLGKSPGEGKGYPLHYSDLENFMDCFCLWGCAELDTNERLTHSPCYISELSTQKWVSGNHCCEWEPLVSGNHCWLSHGYLPQL